MSVVVVTQEVGTRGDEVAAGIAECLGLDFVPQGQLELEVAQRMRTDEGTVHRLVEGNASLFERYKINKRRLLSCLAEEIVKLIAKGNVLIQGPRAVALLGPVRYVLRVHLCIPVRTWARIKTPALTDADLLRHDIQSSNPAASSAQRWLFRSKCEGPPHSDLVLNAERLSLAECVEQVRCLAQSPRFQANADMLRMLASPLKTDFRGEVEVGFRKVSLSGVTSSEQAIARVEEHLRGQESIVQRASIAPPPPAMM